MSITLSDVLKSMETEDTQKVASVHDEVRSEEKTAELTEDNMDELVKKADAEGRAMARGFMDELNKIAVDTDPIQVTPDHGQLPGPINPAVQMPTQGGAVGSPASQVIDSLVSRVGQNGGQIQASGGPVAGAQTQVMAQPLAADVVKAQEQAEAAAKTAGDYIIEELYKAHIG